MKKITAKLLPVLMIFMLCACGKKASSNSLTELFDSGYSVEMSTVSDGTLKVILQNQEEVSYATFTASLSGSQELEYDNIDIIDDDYATTMQDFLTGIEGGTVTDISEVVPSQEDLDSYIGKTIGDIEAEGFANMGYSWSDNECNFAYDNGTIQIDFTVNNVNGIEDPDNASEEEISALEITGAEFTDISYDYFENN